MRSSVGFLFGQNDRPLCLFTGQTFRPFQKLWLHRNTLFLYLYTPLFLGARISTYQHIQKTNWEDCWSQSKIDKLNIKPYLFQLQASQKILYEFREVRSCSLRFEAAPWLLVMAACQYLGQLPLPGVDRIKIRPKRKSVGKSRARFISRKLWL